MTDLEQYKLKLKAAIKASPGKPIPYDTYVKIRVTLAQEVKTLCESQLKLIDALENMNSEGMNPNGVAFGCMEIAKEALADLVKGRG